MKIIITKNFFFLLNFFLCSKLFSQSTLLPSDDPLPPIPIENPKEVAPQRYELVEPYTAFSLTAGEFKLGLINVDYGIMDTLMMGTDFLATLTGAPNLKTKYVIYNKKKNKIALGLKGAYLDGSTILWGSIKENFDKLHARIFSPFISWSKSLSSRLIIHTSWMLSFGNIDIVLSESGKRKLWEAKHPNGNYDTRTESSSDNKADTSDNDPLSFQQQTVIFTSILGMNSNVFQMTGEFLRQSGNKILVACRIQKTELENLKADAFRATAAQQWIWPHFQFRFGVGIQYSVIVGQDLDGESIDKASILPASDIDFYWRF